MQFNQPECWAEENLDNLATFIDYRGKTPVKTNTGVPLITAKNIKDGYINREPREYIALSDYDSWMTRGIPKVGDVLITTEAPMGNVALVDISEVFALAQRAICLQFFYNQMSNYAHYALRCPVFQRALTANSTGTTVSGIKASTLKMLRLPIPPLAEQKVIAEKLDTLLAQVDNTKARLERIPEILKRFRQSVLAAAVSGKLTEEWRRRNYTFTSVGLVNGIVAKNTHKSKPYEPSTPPFMIDESWCWCRLGDIFSLKSGKTIPESEELKSGETPYFKVGDMNDASNQFYMQKAEKFVSGYERSLLPENAIIFPKRGGAIATNKKRILKKESLVDLNVMGIIVPNGIDTIFVYRWFETIDLAQLNTGSSIPQVNNGDIEPLWIPIPPHEEQTEIVRRVEELFAFADRIEHAAQAALSRVNNLTQSILAKAFRGELTAEWRAANPELISGENSAEALLARIKAERAKIKTRKKA